MNSLHKAFILIVMLSNAAKAQTFVTKEGTSRFLIKNSFEDIKAKNTKVFATLDTESGDVSVSFSMKDFSFQNSLMQQNYANDYLEVSKYPNASYRGRISKSVNYQKAGTYEVQVEGRLNLHGVSKPLNFDGTIEVQKNMIVFEGASKIKLADFKIDAPKIAFQKIFESLIVSHLFELEKQ